MDPLTKYGSRSTGIHLAYGTPIYPKWVRTHPEKKARKFLWFPWFPMVPGWFREPSPAGAVHGSLVPPWFP